MALAKKVLRYLQGRKRIPLRWCARSSQQPHLPGHIYGYAYASFADIKPGLVWATFSLSTTAM